MKPPYYIGPLIYSCPPDCTEIRVLEQDLEFVSAITNDRRRAPRRLHTDGSSVGRVLRLPVIGWFVRLVMGGDQFTGPFAWPAIIHDSDYARATESTPWRAFVSPARAAADMRFFEGALCRTVIMPGGRVIRNREHASWIQAAIAHAVLRALGWIAWMDDSSHARRSFSALELSDAAGDTGGSPR